MDKTAYFFSSLTGLFFSPGILLAMCFISLFFPSRFGNNTRCERLCILYKKIIHSFEFQM